MDIVITRKMDISTIYKMDDLICKNYDTNEMEILEGKFEKIKFIENVKGIVLGKRKPKRLIIINRLGAITILGINNLKDYTIYKNMLINQYKGGF